MVESMVVLMVYLMALKLAVQLDASLADVSDVHLAVRSVDPMDYILVAQLGERTVERTVG